MSDKKLNSLSFLFDPSDPFLIDNYNNNLVNSESIIKDPILDNIGSLVL